MRHLELLAPARDLECGKAAIDHGADAVYIGAKRFGARAAAGNSIDDIAELCRYAHGFGAKVYVTVNTIIYDEELDVTERLLSELEHAGADAVLVQDMALVSRTGRMALHASTQTDNRTIEKIRWLRNIGFDRVVLARELSVGEIAEIHNAVPDMELEVFVHGALCVSYSGLCYASQQCFGRSANRGECAQFCRLRFDLTDSEGRVVERGKHLLSLKDMNQSANIERLVEAGAVSFKIEGRLKDITYVKNVTAAYSLILDDIVRRHPDKYCRTSLGRCRYTFTPNLYKTFNRGFTTYFADGRCPDISSPDTPKAIGEFVGTVKELRGISFTVAGVASFANGDGICFINSNRELEGFRVNRVEGNRLFPLKMPLSLKPGLHLYRNNDREFEKLLSRPSAVRKISIELSLNVTELGFSLCAGVYGGRSVTTEIETEHVEAASPQHDNIVRQLTKLGNTIYECADVTLPVGFSYFIPGSKLAQLRRITVEMLEKAYTSDIVRVSNAGIRHGVIPPEYSHPVMYNIANTEARQFYADCGMNGTVPAFELHSDGSVPLMQCRHCLRYTLGYCMKHGGRKPSWREPLWLSLPDGRRFRLEFDCHRCQMNVMSES